jgi:hypothetical protein
MLENPDGIPRESHGTRKKTERILREKGQWIPRWLQ